jgi:hypothetical protein
VTERNQTISAAAVAALIASVSLVALALLPRPQFISSQLSILSGRHSLNAGEIIAYLTYLRRNLTIDSIYLLGHIGMWVGFGTLIERRERGRGRLIMVLGIISGALDLLENEIRWAIAGSIGSSVMSESWALVWQITVGMSFWALLITTLLTVLHLWSGNRHDRMICIIGLCCIPGICMIYFSGYLLTFFWMIVWHAASGVYLWSRASADFTGNLKEESTV